ncbi:MAG: M28 family peptidase [Sphingomonadales bacterium]|nr:M28 family peptidase [Sphingomonadales bacterium]
MTRKTSAAALLALTAALATPAAAKPTKAAPAPASAIPDPDGKGMAWRIVADLTTEVGQRLAATPREAAARDWAVARLKALGLANVRIEPYTMPGWERGPENIGESASLTAPAPQKLAVTALGNSGSTPAAGLTADLAYLDSFAALKALPAGALTGKVAFIDNAMKPNQDGSGYGPYGAARRQGPALAASKGAVAVLIRSIGTDHNRDPHTGVTNWPDGTPPVAAGAVSAPDADLIARIARSGKPMTVSLTMTPRFTGTQPSGNVIAEIPGRNPKLPPILAACHLDSWDLATGAIDDGAGCAIITAAALQATHKGPLLRTVRLLWAGAEERGGFGGAAYAKAHANEPHALAMESDFGADRVWKVVFNTAPANKAMTDRIAAALAPLGIVATHGETEGGTDIEPIIAAQKLPVIDLAQDGTRYFDLHHTPDDTLDKIDPAQLQQNVDAWAAVLSVAGEEPGEIDPVQPAKE